MVPGAASSNVLPAPIGLYVRVAVLEPDVAEIDVPLATNPLNAPVKAEPVVLYVTTEAPACAIEPNRRVGPNRNLINDTHMEEKWPANRKVLTCYSGQFRACGGASLCQS